MFELCGISCIIAARGHAAHRARATPSPKADVKHSSLGKSVSPIVCAPLDTASMRTTQRLSIHSAHSQASSSGHTADSDDRIQARPAGRVRMRPRPPQSSLSAAHSRRGSWQTQATLDSVAETVHSVQSYQTSQTTNTTNTAHTPKPARKRAQALPVPVVIRSEQTSGVQQYSAYLPCNGQLRYREYAIIDGVRHGRMGSEVLRPAATDDDMLALEDVAMHLDQAPDSAEIVAHQRQAERRLRNHAYEVISHDFPEALKEATIQEDGRVQVYVPYQMRERSRSRDRRRHKYFVEQALPPPVPPLPEVRGRGRQHRCKTPTFFSAPGDANHEPVWL